MWHPGWAFSGGPCRLDVTVLVSATAGHRKAAGTGLQSDGLDGKSVLAVYTEIPVDVFQWHGVCSTILLYFFILKTLRLTSLLKEQHHGHPPTKADWLFTSGHAHPISLGLHTLPCCQVTCVVGPPASCSFFFRKRGLERAKLPVGVRIVGQDLAQSLLCRGWSPAHHRVECF